MYPQTNQYRPPQQSRPPVQRAGGGFKTLFFRLLPWLLILLLVVGGVFFGLKMLEDKRVADQVAPYEHVYADNISVDGLSLAGMSAQEAYDALYQKHQGLVDSWQLRLNFRGHSYATANYKLLGIEINSEQIVQKLREAWDLTHVGDNRQRLAAIEALREAPYSSFTTQSELSDQRLDQLLRAIADNISNLHPPKDAQLLQFLPNASDPFLIQPEQLGYKLDVEQARQQIMAMAATGSSGDYELVPEEIHPKVTTADIRKTVTLRGEAQTGISTASPTNRDNNIRVSLEKVNGLVLKPGQTFSFNTVVGQRSYENGFFDAQEYVYGDLVTGIGGGVCQSSSTIYQAALVANLGGFSRRAHSRPVDYTDKGLDATVYYYQGHQIDLKFKNTTNSDIYFTAHVVGANKRKLITRVRIYGQALEDGVMYKLRSMVVETLPPPAEVAYRKDTKAQFVLYKDQTELITREAEGYVTETYLEKYLNGHLVDQRLVSRDTYKPRQRVEWIGTQDRL